MPRKANKPQEQAKQIPFPYGIKISKNGTQIYTYECLTLDSFTKTLPFTNIYMDKEYEWNIKCDDLSRKEIYTKENYDKLILDLI